jgi:hypothetical protein
MKTRRDLALATPTKFGSAIPRLFQLLILQKLLGYLALRFSFLATTPVAGLFVERTPLDVPGKPFLFANLLESLEELRYRLIPPRLNLDHPVSTSLLVLAPFKITNEAHT